MKFDEFLICLRELFPEVTEDQIGRFEALGALYAGWNEKINVISRKDMDSLYDHHVLHSLAIAKYVESLGAGFAPSEHHTVLDLGTGGGFPGIPLAIMFPQWQFTLCDSVGKKTIVAEAVRQAVSLDNVRVVNCRAESLEEQFDFVVSRAVTSLGNFYPWVKDKYKTAIFYLKGGDVNSEISDLLKVSKLKPSKIHTWRIDSVIKDDYFSEKFVIHIEKNYLCTPKSE